jgi:hypothetical protein
MAEPRTPTALKGRSGFRPRASFKRCVPVASLHFELLIMFPTPEQQARDENTHPKQLKNLAAQSIELARIVAANSGASQKLLKKLAKSADRTTREMVTTNPNTPTKILMQLGIEFPQQLLDNPIFSLLLLENPQFLTRIPLKTLSSLVTLPDIHQSFLVEYGIRIYDRQSLLKVLYRLDTSRTILGRLVNHPDRSLANAAKLHINWFSQTTIDKEVLVKQQLTEDIYNFLDVQDYFVILEKLGFCTDAILKIAKKHSNPLICHLVFDYIFFQSFLGKCFKFLKKLFVPFNIFTRSSPWLEYFFDFFMVLVFLLLLAINLLWIGAGIVMIPSIFESLKNLFAWLYLVGMIVFLLPVTIQGFFLFGKKIITLYPIKQTIFQLNNAIKNKIKAIKARQPQTETIVLEKLAKDPSVEVRWNLVCNPNIPPDLLAQLIQDKDILKECDRRADIPKRLLQFFVIEQKRACKPALLKYLKKHSRRCRDWILEAYATAYYPLVRFLVLTPPQSLESILTQGANSLFWLERYAVADNPNTPLFLLEKLAEDANVVVRSVARQNMPPV